MSTMGRCPGVSLSSQLMRRSRASRAKAQRRGQLLTCFAQITTEYGAISPSGSPRGPFVAVGVEIESQMGQTPSFRLHLPRATLGWDRRPTALALLWTPGCFATRLLTIASRLTDKSQSTRRQNQIKHFAVYFCTLYLSSKARDSEDA